MLRKPLYKVGDVLEATYNTKPSTVMKIRDLILGFKVNYDEADEETAEGVEPYRVYLVLTVLSPYEETTKLFPINSYMTLARTEEDLMKKFKRIGHIDISGFTDF